MASQSKRSGADDALEQKRALLRRVRQIEFHARRFVDEAMVGAYHSVFRGQGMEFEEVREYTPGDDVRSIDWNVTAKMGHPFVKKFREERELTIMILVDLSGSGNFGSVEQSKRDLAAEMACVFAISATRNNDKVGLMLFTEEVERYIPPKKGRQHVPRIIDEIVSFRPEKPGTDIVEALRMLNRTQRKRAIVILLSDFLTEESMAWIRPATSGRDDLFRMLALTQRRHDLICVGLSDPRELELPNVGIITLEDAETGEQVEVDTGNAQLRQLYARQNANRIEATARSMRQAGTDYLGVSTAEPYIHLLRQYMRNRARRR